MHLNHQPTSFDYSSIQLSTEPLPSFIYFLPPSLFTIIQGKTLHVELRIGFSFFIFSSIFPSTLFGKSIFYSLPFIIKGEIS